jgi:pyroglutamyl-peptidase
MRNNALVDTPRRSRLLVTGFDIFGRLQLNPSAYLVQSLATKFGNSIDTAVLPTSYADASERSISLIQHQNPRCLLMFGYSARSPGLKLEARAHNRDRARTPDIEQVVRVDNAILDDAPCTYTSTAPVSQLHGRLTDQGIPVVMSRSAGGYVCNHVYFLALHHGQLHGIPRVCLFVHVPDWQTLALQEHVSRGAELLVAALGNEEGVTSPTAA